MRALGCALSCHLAVWQPRHRLRQQCWDRTGRVSRAEGRKEVLILASLCPTAGMQHRSFVIASLIDLSLQPMLSWL